MNDLIIRKYIKARRVSKDTKKKDMQALNYFNDFLKRKDFKQMKISDLEGFQPYLNNYKYKGSNLVVTTRLKVLQIVCSFLNWLKKQEGFKRIITNDMADYFKLRQNEKNIMRSQYSKIKEYPNINDIECLLDTLDKNNLKDRRTIAFLCYLLLTGARLSAAVTMKIDLLDLNKYMADQDPEKGVKTKNSKRIVTTIPHISQKALDNLRDWVGFLESMGFRGDDPLFPKTINAPNDGCIQFTKATKYMKESISPGSMAKLVKEAFKKSGFPNYHCHSLRDTNLDYCLSKVNSIKESKAISVNVGHESLLTTFRDYGDMSSEEVYNIIRSISLKRSTNLDDLPEHIKDEFFQIMRIYHKDEYNRYFCNVEGVSHES